MKANEFIKQYGIEKAKQIVFECEQFVHVEKPTHFDSDLDIFINDADFDEPDESDVLISDLKRLVESHELVESYGGLENAKHEVSKRPSQTVVKQAIADVESCQKLEGE